MLGLLLPTPFLLHMLASRRAALLFGACLAAKIACAQQPTPTPTKTFVISPIVGETIDLEEKKTYGLFPYYSADNYQQAHFEQSQTSDSTITLHVALRDGRTVLRPFTAAEVAAVRTSIEARQRELGSVLPPRVGTSVDSVGRRFRVTLRTGTTFDGEMTAHRPAQLEFLTKDLGVVQVERSNILRLEELTSALAKRPANWFNIGNGNRLFFQPTARNLRRGEGSLQSISIYLLGANYGINDNFSVGLLASLVPALPLRNQLIAFTPKGSARVSEKWYAGGGLLYLRVAGESAGIFYGNATYGSADHNLTLGLGYGFVSGEIGATPVIQLGGQTRVSRRISLISENYLLANGNAGMGGLYGIKINWRRTSLGLGAAYLVPYKEAEYAFTTYIVPVYIDFTFRFGKPAR